jgi:hypothetical protein
MIDLRRIGSGRENKGRRKNQIGATERSKTVRDCESRKFVRFVTTNAATPTSIIPFTSV